jgi:Ni/Co efflux regulator RcnB
LGCLGGLTFVSGKIPCPDNLLKGRLSMKIRLLGYTALLLLGTQSVQAQPDGQPDGQHGGQNGPQQRQGTPQHQASDNGHGRQAQMRRSGWARDRGDDYRWRRGQRMGYNDWSNADPIDYREHRLRKPPRGYEWRRHNDQYVLVAVATGLIASIILNSGR